MITRNRALARDFRELLSSEIEHFFSLPRLTDCRYCIRGRDLSFGVCLALGACANPNISTRWNTSTRTVLARRERGSEREREKPQSFRRAILYFVSQSVSSANKAALPIAFDATDAFREQDSRALSRWRGKLVARGHAGQDTFRGVSFRSVLCNLPQHATRKRKWSKENRRGHPGGIADSKVASRNA